jgi:copper(I)-binding protein
MMPKMLVVAIALSILAGTAGAETFRAGTIEIVDPWIPAPPKGADVAGGYMTIRNTGTAPDRLIGGTADAAGRVEVHEMTMDDNVMRMRPIQGGLEIKPGATVALTPGSLHLMLTGLTRALTQGQHVKGSLQFEKAGKIDVQYGVEPMGATGASAAHQTPHAPDPRMAPGANMAPGMNHGMH